LDAWFDDADYAPHQLIWAGFQMVE